MQKNHSQPPDVGYLRVCMPAFPIPTPQTLKQVNMRKKTTPFVSQFKLASSSCSSCICSGCERARKRKGHKKQKKFTRVRYPSYPIPSHPSIHHLSVHPSIHLLLCAIHPEKPTHTKPNPLTTTEVNSTLLPPSRTIPYIHNTHHYH